MQRLVKALNDHYGQPDLPQRIRLAFERLGIDPQQVTRDHLADLDEIHIRGREATLEAGRAAGLEPGQKVLDAGCGLGGPARTLAATFGCEVVGLEIVGEFCRAAAMLTEWVGLSERVTFQEGDVGAMPFVEAAFDRVVTLHTLMNVKEKGAFFAEVRRVLKPTGGLFLYEVCRRNGGRLHYPVPWAGGTELSFLMTAADMRAQVQAMGFAERHWSDVTAEALSWFDGLAELRIQARPRTAGPNLGVVLGPDAGKKSRNLQKNLREGRIQVVQGYFVTR
jgi:ubiquinone/menaquinone biosynthesis C-methylase UbiE